MDRSVALACALAACLGIAAPARPAAAQSETIPGDKAVMFARDAALGNMAEVRLGKLASTHASSDQVKQFAAKMVADHAKADEQLRAITAKKQIALPSDLDGVHHALAQKLEGLKGTAFDIAYMNAMVDDHMKTVASFTDEAQHGVDPDLKAFAAATLPTLETHLQMAKQVDDAVKK
jgi:putative membrane protein